ncbi:hypothetical protein Q5752_003308 [Cryptotrichosporon argae]
MLALLALALAGSASSALAQSTTASAGASLMTSSTLKLAKRYAGSDFENDFKYFTDTDPTNGYVNYVSLSDGQSAGLVGVQSDGSFVMKADSTKTGSGRGRDSIRISSKDKYADGVYILDLNHMPVGCGTWPAFWTVVESGWPKGGEIDIIEGTNALPSLYSAAWNASSLGANATTAIPYDVASLHTSSTCALVAGSYMTGTEGNTACSAYDAGNLGCGVDLAGESVFGTDSFGPSVNAAGGGYYAMWRDLTNSGGVYIYFWPRNATNIPADVTDSTATTTSVADWGEPAANLTVPCTSDFGDHVITFDITFCGDYAGATYSASGCPSTCTSFVQNNPGAFAETYWSVNSLRVYNASGKAVSSSALSAGAIAGIVVGAVAAGVIAYLLYRRARYTRRRRLLIQAQAADDAVAAKEAAAASAGPGAYAFVAREQTAFPKKYSATSFGGEIPALPYVADHSAPRRGSGRPGGASWVG